ncbi:CBL-interacting protein kinase 31 [Capsaspora owczarzaki ATCC 30864]|uniref:ULK/ULK protein kinase n=1 Tax=Capsaspora owczarzaki (strain ATCC 30864) TaxID=595528 RepID=A0A0D2WPT0_CAPO3|nr:CBL-interacting protein kinase 31 [Capsaspora owczarzaki ATCC 30864]KJE92758.1 ULK/ULK protein kinase [Capsaspora owczarzaki ATCC 30864]|eukprot:XP_004363393.2 CBL-interacting protein kinase 31 [Capsaspora owczarzaki ATCC 30864]
MQFGGDAVTSIQNSNHHLHPSASSRSLNAAAVDAGGANTANSANGANGANGSILMTSRGSNESKSSGAVPFRSVGAYFYHVEQDLLGGGSFARVYRATHKFIHGHYAALKQVKRNALDTRRAAVTLRLELTTMRRLNHPNVVRLYGSKETRENIYLLMEYCAAGDLGHFIDERGRLSEAVTRSIMTQLIAALLHMRSANVTHRDIKPRNLLLQPFAHGKLMVKVADFGLACQQQAEERHSEICGSPLYMAPEILMQRRYGPSVDLWSAGVVQFECITGHVPYRAASGPALLDAIRAAQSQPHPLLGSQAVSALQPSVTPSPPATLRNPPPDRSPEPQLTAGGGGQINGSTANTPTPLPPLNFEYATLTAPRQIAALQPLPSVSQPFRDLLCSLLQMDAKKRASFDDLARNPYLNVTRYNVAWHTPSLNILDVLVADERQCRPEPVHAESLDRRLSIDASQPDQTHLGITHKADLNRRRSLDTRFGDTQAQAAWSASFKSISVSNVKDGRAGFIKSDAAESFATSTQAESAIAARPPPPVILINRATIGTSASKATGPPPLVSPTARKALPEHMIDVESADRLQRDERLQAARAASRRSSACAGNEPTLTATSSALPREPVIEVDQPAKTGQDDADSDSDSDDGWSPATLRAAMSIARSVSPLQSGEPNQAHFLTGIVPAFPKTTPRDPRNAPHLLPASVPSRALSLESVELAGSLQSTIGQSGPQSPDVDDREVSRAMASFYEEQVRQVVGGPASRRASFDQNGLPLPYLQHRSNSDGSVLAHYRRDSTLTTSVVESPQPNAINFDSPLPAFATKSATRPPPLPIGISVLSGPVPPSRARRTNEPATAASLEATSTLSTLDAGSSTPVFSQTSTASSPLRTATSMQRPSSQSGSWSRPSPARAVRLNVSAALAPGNELWNQSALSNFQQDQQMFLTQQTQEQFSDAAAPPVVPRSTNLFNRGRRGPLNN